MFREIGRLNDIQVINEAPLIASFTLLTETDAFHCIVDKSEFVEKLLLFPNGKYIVYVQGDYNRKNQLIVSDIAIRNPDNTSNLLLFKQNQKR